MTDASLSHGTESDSDLGRTGTGTGTGTGPSSGSSLHPTRQAPRDLLRISRRDITIAGEVTPSRGGQWGSQSRGPGVHETGTGGPGLQSWAVTSGELASPAVYLANRCQ